MAGRDRKSENFERKQRTESMDPKGTGMEQSGILIKKDSQAVCQTPQGVQIHAWVKRLTRHTAVIEVYTPSVVLQLSEVLSDFRILAGGRTIYAGRGTIRGIINTGVTLVCEVTLDDTKSDYRFLPPPVLPGSASA